MAIGTGAAIIGAGIGGALISSNAARGASRDQAAATDRATEQTQRQFDITRADSAPIRGAGNAAIAQLRQFLGIGPGSQPVDYSGSLVDVTGGVPAPRQDLYDNDQAYRKAWDQLSTEHQSRFFSPYTSDSSSSAIESELRKRLPTSPAAPAAQPASAAPLAKKFSIDDFWADPVTQLSYQSGLDLGTKALKNAAPLTFGLDSGAAMKELTKFGTEYAGSKAGDSYARFEGDKTNVFNRLMALVGGGQVANQVNANAGTNMANTNAGLLTDLGAGQSAARIAGAGALTGGLSSIANWWQNNDRDARQQSNIDRYFNLAGRGGGRTISPFELGDVYSAR